MLRVGFVTCVELGLSCIEEIYACGGHLDLAITLRDDIAPTKSGRVSIDRFCNERGVDVHKVKHINDESAIAAIKDHHIDWLFIVGWSQVAARTVLDAPSKGVLGIHPTLLPVGRGRAPIPWAIIKGLECTGVTLFALDEGVDTGPILAQEILPIAPDENATSLYARVNAAHRSLIRQTWSDLVTDRLTAIPQDESQATVWPVRRQEDGRITTTMSVLEVDRLVRGCTKPYPGAFYENDKNKWIVWGGHKAEVQETPENSLGVWIKCRDGGYVATEVKAIPKS